MKKRIGRKPGGSDVLERLLKERGQAPDVVFDGKEVRQWTRTSVLYAWVRNGKVLYIGKGGNSTGIGRPLTRSHHVLPRIQDSDQLLVWFFEDDYHGGLCSEETRLIRELCPVMNRTQRDRGRTYVL
jgi:hypothetical protein